MMVGQNIFRNDLILRNPYEVYTAITQNEDIKRWHKFISEYYLPPLGKKILLFYPCSATKPYTDARSYKQLFKNLANLGEKRKLVHILTVSEPFALVPEEFYNKKTEWYDWENGWYDCPGLFEWWCKLKREPYDANIVKSCINLLSDVVAGFFKRLKSKRYLNNIRLVGFVRTYSSSLKVTLNNTHRLILEEASKKAGVSLVMLPEKEFVKNLIKRRGRAAWDFYGISHPLAQNYLIKKLMRLL